MKRTAPGGDDLLEMWASRNLKKKEHYFQAGGICQATAYVNSGCMRRYVLTDNGKKTIVNFAMKDWWIGDLESFLFQKPILYHAQVWEDTELLLLPFKQFQLAQERFP